MIRFIVFDDILYASQHSQGTAVLDSQNEGSNLWFLSLDARGTAGLNG